VNALTARAGTAAALAWLSLLCATGCAQTDVVSVPLMSTLPPDAGSGPVCPYRQQVVRTTANGAPVTLDAANLAAFRHAICACDSVLSTADLHVDGFDSALGAYDPDAPNNQGSLDVNHGLRLEGSAIVAEHVTVAGSDGVNLGSNELLSAGTTLSVGGPLEGSGGSVRVGSDALVAGRIVLDNLSVPGTLTQPSGATLDVSGDKQIGQQQTAALTIATPCGCADDQLLDVSALVQAGVARAHPISPDATIDPPDCREFSLAAHTVDAWHIRANSSAAIYVAGGLHVRGDFNIEAAPGARLDIFIETELSVDGMINLQGNADDVRLYLGGAGTLPLADGGELHAALYAPRAELVLSATLNVYGALFLRRVAAYAPLALHYDASVGRP
jgi:hypothetical protein